MEHLELILTGIAVVMTVLLLLWGACFLVSVTFHSRPTKQERETVPSPPEGIPAHHVAAITAAVAAMTPGAFRIVNVRAPALIATAWADEGRFAQATSHRVRWDWTAPGPKQHPTTRPDRSDEN